MNHKEFTRNPTHHTSTHQVKKFLRGRFLLKAFLRHTNPQLFHRASKINSSSNKCSYDRLTHKCIVRTKKSSTTAFPRVIHLSIDARRSSTSAFVSFNSAAVRVDRQNAQLAPHIFPKPMYTTRSSSIQHGHIKKSWRSHRCIYLSIDHHDLTPPPRRPCCVTTLTETKEKSFLVCFVYVRLVLFIRA